MGVLGDRRTQHPLFQIAKVIFRETHLITSARKVLSSREVFLSLDLLLYFPFHLVDLFLCQVGDFFETGDAKRFALGFAPA